MRTSITGFSDIGSIRWLARLMVSNVRQLRLRLTRALDIRKARAPCRTHLRSTWSWSALTYISHGDFSRFEAAIFSCHVVQVGHHVIGQVIHRHHRAADRLGDRGGNLLIELRLQEDDLHVVVAGLGDEAERLAAAWAACLRPRPTPAAGRTYRRSSQRPGGRHKTPALGKAAGFVRCGDPGRRVRRGVF